jgi:hypothetical protein
MEQEKFDIKKVKVHRTPEGTIFEMTVLVILLSAWIVSIATQKLTTTDEWYDLGVLSIVTIVSLLCAYSPSHINLFSIQLRNIRQVELLIRMVRILAVGLALMSVIIAAFGSDSPLTKVFCIGVLAVIGVIGFVFIYLIQKTE